MHPPPDGMERWLAKVRLPGGRWYIQDFFVSLEVRSQYGTAAVEQLLCERMQDIAARWVDDETERLLKGAKDDG